MAGCRTARGFAAAVAIAWLVAPTAAQDNALADLLGRAAVYVGDFQRQLSGIVAEETYVQDVLVLSTIGSAARPRITHRELKSDLLLVRPVGLDRWMQFRDTFEVDGRPVRDRSERLVKLFLTPTSSTASQAEHIAAESFRYNIGNLQRTVNVPVLALMVLDPAVQPRFRFKRADKTSAPPVRSAIATAAEPWVIEYQEAERQTIITTTFGRDMPAQGRFWIEAATGRVFASELIAADATIRGVIHVGYDIDQAVKLLVPIEMRERYDIRRDASRLDGKATYGKFRQFQVKVDENIAPIKDREHW
jgi:hypothetical protein